MEIPEEHKGRYFYHFTHVDNIESIIENGLLCTNEKERLGINHLNVANNGIQNRRDHMSVTCEPYGTVHDYVPFYFGSKSLMLLAVINKKIVDQKLMVYMCISIDKLEENNVIFTDRAANANIPPNFYQNPKDLDQLNWNLIDSNRWREEIEDKPFRMAEVLVYKAVPIDWIECYIVFDEKCKKKIKDIYKELGRDEPNIYTEPLGSGREAKFFYWRKYRMKGRKEESTITGPRELYKKYKKAVEKIISERAKWYYEDSAFENVNDALIKIEGNFCVIDELKGIYQLETDNSVHSDTVSDHTLKVVNNLELNEYYQELSEDDKKIVKLSAYFHDIGKGPKSKWSDEIQPFYPDHPADSIPMIKRILSEEFWQISDYSIKKICLLVFYHDLIGDIIREGRSKQELLNLNVSENELNMLIAISIADASSIKSEWGENIEVKAPQLKEEILVND